jgi:hypothetical protein
MSWHKYGEFQEGPNQSTPSRPRLFVDRRGIMSPAMTPVVGIFLEVVQRLDYHVDVLVHLAVNVNVELFVFFYGLRLRPAVGQRTKGC